MQQFFTTGQDSCNFLLEKIKIALQFLEKELTIEIYGICKQVIFQMGGQ